MKARLFTLLSLIVIFAPLVPGGARLTVAQSGIAPLAIDDEFDSLQLGAHWFWAHEDPTRWSLTERPE